MLIEIKGSLFDAPSEFYIAHCISADFALGAGIAKAFRDKLGMKNKLLQEYQQYNVNNIGKALLIDNCFNLITKELYFHKPTYNSLTSALLDMKKQCAENNITKLAMPKIGCGLDRLEWDKVKPIIERIFFEDSFEVRIYSL